MRGTIVRIGATGAGTLLALGLFAGPSAGATGPDNQNNAERTAKVTCFDAASADHTQGRSLSDPDGMTNDGADKPGTGCTGGVNKTDRDGNNGCGNDADREDDNNGNCDRQEEASQAPGNAAAEQKDVNDDKVKAEKVDADVTVQAAGTAQAAGVLAAEASTTTTTTTAPTTVLGSSATAPSTPDTQVLGETLSQPGTLARTGAGIGGLALLGGLLCGGGRLTVLARKLLRIG
jgi:hypothetical protein